jgi:hypothetical protein
MGVSNLAINRKNWTGLNIMKAGEGEVKVLGTEASVTGLAGARQRFHCPCSKTEGG